MQRTGKVVWDWWSLWPYPVCTHFESLEGYPRDRKGGSGLKESVPLSSLHWFWITNGLCKEKERGYWTEEVLIHSAIYSESLKGYTRDRKGGPGLKESVSFSSLHSFWITGRLCKGQERGYWVEGVCIIPCESLEGYAGESKGGIRLKKSLSSLHSVWITKGLRKRKERVYQILWQGCMVSGREKRHKIIWLWMAGVTCDKRCGCCPPPPPHPLHFSICMVRGMFMPVVDDMMNNQKIMSFCFFCYKQSQGSTLQ